MKLSEFILNGVVEPTIVPHKKDDKTTREDAIYLRVYPVEISDGLFDLLHKSEEMMTIEKV